MDTLLGDRGTMQDLITLGDRKRGAFTLALVSVLYGFSVIQFRHGHLLIGNNLWADDILILTGMCALCAAPFCLSRESALHVKAGCLVAQLIPILVILYPATGSLVPETILVMALLIQSGILLPTKVHVGFTIIIILSGLAFVWQVPSSAWNVEAAIEQPSFIDIAFFSGAGFLTAFGFGVTRVLLVRIDTHRSLMQRYQHSVERLSEANSSFIAYAQTAGRNATMRERKRISREIHDLVGHALVNIIMMLEAALQTTRNGNRANLTNLLWQAKAQASDSLTETRRAVHLLRDLASEHVPSDVSFRRLVNSFSGATGIEVDLQLTNTPRYLPPRTGYTVYRVLQESLTNVVRHAHATRVFMYLRVLDETLAVDVSDNGGGSNSSTPGAGLSGLQERVQEMDGTFAVHSSTSGFQVSVRIPLSTQREGRKAL